MKIGKISNKGGRVFNQDYADYAVEGEFVCVAVADGLGAYSGSEIAGETAVKSALKWFRKAVRKEEEIFSGAAMNKLFKCAHTAIHKIKNDAPELKHSCTTLSVVIADKNNLIAAHEGDTRIYFFKSGTVEFYSKDHSLARLAADRGEISYSDIRTHKDQNKLTRVIGSDYFVQPDFKLYSGYASGDAVIVCTDGFWEYVYESDMEEALSSTDGAQDSLDRMEALLLSRASEGNDNYSAIVLRFGSEEAGGYGAEPKSDDESIPTDETLPSDNAESENAADGTSDGLSDETNG